MRDKYRVTETTCEHSFRDEWGCRRTVRYWVHEGGGYVWYTNGIGRNVQPCDASGATWRARTGAEIRELCKAARRLQRREGLA